jgi:hypothetical protein
MASLLLALAQAALQIRPSSEDWQAGPADVRAVLESAAAPLWSRSPGRTLPPINVARRGGPIVLYRRAADGALQVKLETGEHYWCQYVYQFAHEFCHILSNFREEADTRHKWLEESLCETASLWTLRRVAEDWERRPPYPNWKSFAPRFREYADERLAESKLPQGRTFASWFAENAPALAAKPDDRPKNAVVAAALLPLFEEEPDGWAALEHLNAGPVRPGRTLARFLDDWREACPEARRPFVAKVARLFTIP